MFRGMPGPCLKSLERTYQVYTITFFFVLEKMLPTDASASNSIRPALLMGGREDASLVEAAEVQSSLEAVSCQMQDQARACSPADQPVWKFKDGLGINMTMKTFFTFRTE